MKENTEEKKTRFKSILIDGTKYKTHLTKKFVKRIAWTEPNLDTITSFIPGNIVKVYIKAGQTIKEGDTAIVFEAMKMKNRITFHRNGVVKKIFVKEGDVVPKGMVLVELEPIKKK
jgi:biotin carboxyl carrier protein